MQAAVAYQRSHVGPYQLLAKIGEGGMGTVHLARLAGPAGFNKLAVVKELRPDLASSPEFMEMFLNEARLAARLTHPNVVHTYGADEHNGCLYIAMEYLDGQPWVRVRHRLWSNRSLPLAVHLHVLSELLAGLHYAHELCDFNGQPLQVVHCDVSPHNVFVTYDGQVKIVDFGVARAVTSSDVEPELFVGKLSYAAPEQVARHALDRRADVFAVGVMLWEAVAGRRFVEGRDKAEVMRRRISGAEPRVREVVPSASPILSAICDRALSLDPARRFATAAEFRNAIQDYLSDSGQRVDGTQVGQLVAAAFREERERVHRLIEQSVTQPSHVVPEQLENLDAVSGVGLVENTLRADLSEFATVSRLADDKQVAQAVTQASVRQPVELIRGVREGINAPVATVVALILAVLVGVVFLFQPESANPEAEVAAALAAATEPGQVAALGGSVAQGSGSTQAIGSLGQMQAQQPPAAADVTAPVSLVLRATPRSAVLYLNGKALPTNPYELERVPSNEVQRLAADGPGLIRQEREIIFNQDREVSFKLEAAERPLAAQRRLLRPRVARRARRESVLAPEPSAPEAVSREPGLTTSSERSEGAEGLDEVNSELPPLRQRFGRQPAGAIYEEVPY